MFDVIIYVGIPILRIAERSVWNANGKGRTASALLDSVLNLAAVYS